jgi:hypothetical protein
MSTATTDGAELKESLCTVTIARRKELIGISRVISRVAILLERAEMVRVITTPKEGHTFQRVVGGGGGYGNNAEQIGEIVSLLQAFNEWLSVIRLGDNGLKVKIYAL